MKGRVIPMWRFFRHANWNGTLIDWAKEEPKMGQIIRHICLLLIIQFLSRLCNIFFIQINSADSTADRCKYYTKCGKGFKIGTDEAYNKDQN